MSNLISDIEFLKDLYASASNKYKPSSIRTLLIAESPPNNLERFFYFEDVKRQDSLFLEIMGVLYPQLKEQYLLSGRDTDLKKELLEHFKADGFWLMDLAEVPLSIEDKPLQSFMPSLLERLQKHISKHTPIILIKASVYDTCYPVLLAHGYNVNRERLPFPGSGQQLVFRDKFSRAINY